MFRCAPGKHSIGLTGRTESTYMINWKSKRWLKASQDQRDVCSAYVWPLCGRMDDGEGNAAKRCLNKAKLLELERHWKAGLWFKIIVMARKSALKSSRWNWASRKAKCCKQKREINAQLQRGPQRKFKGNSSKNLGMKGCCAAIGKTSPNQLTKSKKTSQEMSLNYLWKPLIWRLEEYLYQRMKVWNSFPIDVKRSRILTGFKMEKSNFWQGVIRGGCKNIGPVWASRELPC